MYSIKVILIIAALFSFISTFFLIPFFIKRSKKLRLMDYPGDRKVHDAPIPRIGGISIILSFIPVICIYVFFGSLSDNFFTENIIFIISTLIIICIGVLDDIYTITPFNKFFFQLLASVMVVVISDFKFDLHLNMASNIYLDAFSVILSIIFIIGITNAINLMDGLDGLSGGVCIIISATFLMFSMIIGNSYVFMLFLIPFIFSVLAFLYYNRFPAKIFLGDSGSLLIGWSFAMMAIIFSKKADFELSLIIPIMILSLPASDTLLVMQRRFFKNSNQAIKNRLKGMFHGDNNHIHHLILNAGYNTNQSILIIYFILILTSIFSYISLVFYSNSLNLFINLTLIFMLIILIRNKFSKLKKKK